MVNAFPAGKSRGGVVESVVKTLLVNDYRKYRDGKKCYRKSDCDLEQCFLKSSSCSSESNTRLAAKKTANGTAFYLEQDQNNEQDGDDN
jgi:hypothetical protein